MDQISIIMPVYNTEEFVAKSIESVLNQVFTNTELIIINDNSNTSCTELLKELSQQDSRIKLFHFQEKQGVGAARNFGMQKAEGQFIYFLDSDDYLPEMTLKILMDNIKQNDMIRGRIKNTNFSSAMAIIYEGLFKTNHYTDTKYKLIKNNSALNLLIRKDFIQEHHLSFSDEVTIYTDLCFLLPAFIHSDQILYVKEAIYFKRKRNDPISNPSLIQSGEETKIADFLYVYNGLKQMYDDQLAHDYLDTQLLNFYRKTIITHFKADYSQIDTLYSRLVDSAKKIQQNLTAQYDWVLKNEIKALKYSTLKKYTKVLKRHDFFRDLRKAVKSRRKFYIFLHQRFFLKMKLKENLVFFESFLAKNYSDSPKYIYEYMINNNMDYKYVWSVREDKEIPGNAIQVKRFSLRYFYYISRAKYWVSNIRLPKSIQKPNGNIYLQTWHGTPLKTLVFDQDDIHSADPNYKKNFYEQSRRWDYLSSPNQYSSDIFRRAFKFNKTLLEYGYPRNDVLYQNNNDTDIKNLKKTMGLPLNKKVILYAPTWRDDEFYSRGNYKFTLQLDLDKMQETFNHEYVLLLRTHYHVATQLDVSAYDGFVFNVSGYDDIAELYLMSDILITDYSSVFFDYAHLKRPILFYTYDLEKYRDTLRGFYFDMEEEVPGPLLMTTDEVVHALKNIAQISADYKNKYDQFYQKFCSWDDGHASEKTVQTVFDAHKQ